MTHPNEGTTTASWGPWNHSKSIPEDRSMFLKAKLHKESRNGFKKINCCRFKKKNFFSAQKNVNKNWTFFWSFEFLFLFSKDILHCKFSICNYSPLIIIWLNNLNQFDSTFDLHKLMTNDNWKKPITIINFDIKTVRYKMSVTHATFLLL